MFDAAFADEDGYSAAPPDDGYLSSLLDKPHVIILAAVVGDEVVGGLLAYELPKLEQARSEIYIYDLAVAETWRRRGVATALIGEVRRIGREVGAWTVFVQADMVPEDEPARTLYRKLAVAELAALHFDIEP